MPRKKKVKEEAKAPESDDLQKLKAVWFRLAKSEVIGKTHYLTKRLDELTEQIRNHV